MCDEDTVRDNEDYLKRISRRGFGTLAGAAGLMAMLPRAANAQEVTEADVMIETPDGMADCFFAHPAEDAHAGVIVWPDIMGLRPAFKAMGRRLAESGYSVLTVNPYYRDAAAPVIAEGESFSDPPVRERLMPLAQSLRSDGAQTVRDAQAYVQWLDAQDSVDTSRQIGTTGYCMGGPLVMMTAAAIPDRIGAGGSFHGGGLTTEGDDSPHLLIPQMQAGFLIAIAANDDERQPESKDILRAAFDDAGLMAEIEVYEGAMHGWCPPDSTVYNEAQAERAWERLLALFGEALA
ncbi:MAG: dienelactone hydrolase family protein [Maricaulaceae bacterium]|jgi:carboxymethylenebutenolidase